MNRLRHNPPRRGYLIETRSVEGGTWRTIDTASSRERALDALLGAEGVAALRWGDLVLATSAAEVIGLAVMTERRGLVLAPRPPRRRRTDWFTFWERSDNPYELLSYPLGLDLRRIAMASAGIVRIALTIPGSPSNSRRALEAVEAWARGRATRAEVGSVVNAAESSAQELAGTGIAYRIALAALSAVEVAASDTEREALDHAWRCARWTAEAIYQSSQLGTDIDVAASIAATNEAQQQMVKIIHENLPLSVVLLAQLGEQFPFTPMRPYPHRAPRRNPSATALTSARGQPRVLIRTGRGPWHVATPVEARRIASEMFGAAARAKRPKPPARPTRPAARRPSR